jgi:hypothetical protein
MIERSELKWGIRPESAVEIMRELRDQGASVLFPARRIFSVYYDDQRLKNFVLGEEGVVPRTKTRVRWYDSLVGYQDDPKLEYKVTGTNSRRKMTSSLGDRQLDEHADLIGVKQKVRQKQLVPVTLVTYVRRYYQIGDSARFTLDEDISYARVYSFDLLSLKIGPRLRDSWMVFEMKTPNETEFLDIGDEFPASRSRFSKYARSIEFTQISNARY